MLRCDHNATLGEFQRKKNDAKQMVLQSFRVWFQRARSRKRSISLRLVNLRMISFFSDYFSFRRVDDNPVEVIYGRGFVFTEFTFRKLSTTNPRVYFCKSNVCVNTNALHKDTTVCTWDATMDLELLESRQDSKSLDESVLRRRASLPESQLRCDVSEEVDCGDAIFWRGTDFSPFRKLHHLISHFLQKDAFCTTIVTRM